jgi:menaquinone-dependent protoporphyrinogen oxidase
MRILSVYASAHGSTAEVARFIGEVWQRCGLETLVASAGAVRSVEGYDAYVLASAIHNGLWLPEMAAFVRRNREHLSEKPVYLWLTCLRAVESGGYAYVTNNYLPNLLTRTLSFRRIGIFAGKVDTATLDRDEAWTLTFRYDGSRDVSTLGGDHRDWNAIRAWAERVADDLVPGRASGLPDTPVP